MGKVQRLPDTVEMRKLEARFISLFERTFLKGALRTPGPRIKDGVKRAFKTKTFEMQIDQIIDDIYRVSCAYADRVVGKPPSIYSALRPLYRGRPVRRASALRGGPYPLTEEIVRLSTELSSEASEAIIRMLQDEGIYELHPNQLERRIRDLFGGQKYRAVRFARTVTADIGTNTAVHRYRDQGIEYLQFYAKLDDRTTPQCRMLHGTIIKTEWNDAKTYRPPLHHNCRSDLLPVPRTYKINDDLLLENRDFTRHYDQDFNPLGVVTDDEQVLGVIDKIDAFNNKWRIQRFILDQDTELRLMKLNLSLEGVPPKSLPKPKPKPEPPKPEPEPNIPKHLEPHTPYPNRFKPKFQSGEDTIKEINDEVNKANKLYDTRQKKITKMNDERNKLVQEYNELGYKKWDILHDPKSPGLLSSTETDIIDARRAILQKDMDKLQDKIDKASRKMYADYNSISDIYSRKLLLNDEGPTTAELFTNKENISMAAEKRQYVDKTIKYMNEHATQELRYDLPQIRLADTTEKRSAAYVFDTMKGGKDPVIWLSDNDASTGTLIHELGHQIEYSNPSIKQAANDFLERRTAGKEVKTLNELTNSTRFEPHEVAKEGGFINPYVGKIYGDKATEVVSMGVEALWRYPSQFIKDDPEHASLIIDILRGRYC